MRTDSEMNDILSLGFMHYTTAVSLEMSDEPILSLGFMHYTTAVSLEMSDEPYKFISLFNRFIVTLCEAKIPDHHSVTGDTFVSF